MRLARRWRRLDGGSINGALVEPFVNTLARLVEGCNIEVSLMYQQVLWVISLVSGGDNLYPSAECFI
jgi:hypothetical protein